MYNLKNKGNSSRFTGGLVYIIMVFLYVITMMLPVLTKGYPVESFGTTWIRDYHTQFNEVPMKYNTAQLNYHNHPYGGKKYTQIDFQPQSVGVYNSLELPWISNQDNLPYNPYHEFQRNENQRLARQRNNQLVNAPSNQDGYRRINLGINQKINLGTNQNPSQKTSQQTLQVSPTGAMVSNGFGNSLIVPGSGSLGITRLSNGQFALGSGSLGYGTSPIRTIANNT